MNLRLLPLFCLPLFVHAQTPTEHQRYTCDNGSRLEISLLTASDERPFAILTFAGQSMTLPQVPAAVGSLYRQDGVRLQLRDEQAQFEDGQGDTRRCLLGDSGPSAPVASSSPAVPSSFIDVTGSVSYRLRRPLPTDAVLVVRVRDLSRDTSRVLAELRIALAGQTLPIPFATSIDRDLIGKKSQISISARIEGAGRVLFVSDRAYPALAGGEARHQKISLRQVGRTRAD
jgi:putative lipoprotein